MKEFGALLWVFAIVSLLTLHVFLLVNFLRRARKRDHAIGELCHTILLGHLLKSYRDLLLQDGITPTFLDEVLHRVDILLWICLSIGLLLMILGFYFQGVV